MLPAIPVIIAKAALGGIVGKVLDRRDVPIKNESVPATVKKVEEAISDAVKDGEVALVNVKSSWTSKIEWVQILGAVAVLASMFGFDLDAKEQAAIVTVIALGSQVVTWVMRRWFTTSVTKSSAKGA